MPKLVVRDAKFYWRLFFRLTKQVNMPLWKTFKHRALHEEEIIDDFSLGGAEVAKAFDTIERVNKFLGGNKILVHSVKKVIHQYFPQKTNIVITDLGSGSGDGLRAIARWARRAGQKLSLKGVDANPFIVEYAAQAANDLEEITFEKADIFDPAYRPDGADIVTFNLCLHHFSDQRNLQLLQKCREAGVQIVLINDLHRNGWAYYLFLLFCWLTGANRIARLDGLISIRKGFTRPELQSLGRSIGPAAYSISWKWAFRYQMIINFEL